MALRPQWGNTYLDVAKVKKAFGGAKSLIFTVSDGGIANWGDIREDFIKYKAAPLFPFAAWQKG